MGNEVAGLYGPPFPREVDRQCRVREVNEGGERLYVARAPIAERLEVRCECGDAACEERLWLSHADYEAVRGYGSRFIVSLNHENPENAWVLCEKAGYSVIDVVGGIARHQVLACNPRHEWVDAQDGRT